MTLSVGDIVLMYMTQHGLTQTQLARVVGCTRAMICMIVHNKKQPGEALASRMADALADSPIEQQGLRFLLRGLHRQARKIMEEYPDAFKDFGPSRDGENDSGVTVR